MYNKTIVILKVFYISLMDGFFYKLFYAYKHIAFLLYHIIAFTLMLHYDYVYTDMQESVYDRTQHKSICNDGK